MVQYPHKLGIDLSSATGRQGIWVIEAKPANTKKRHSFYAIGEIGLTDWARTMLAETNGAATPAAISTSGTHIGGASPNTTASVPQVTAPQQLPADLVAVVNESYAALDTLDGDSKEAQNEQRAAVVKLRLPLEVKSSKIGIAFRLIPAGYFVMGSPQAEKDAMVAAGAMTGDVNRETQHLVKLTHPFYCGKYPITQGQWEGVMGSNPSCFKNAGNDAPVEMVSWDDCQAFLKKLCELEGVPKGTYRLLTEAEWEYACRAGTDTPLYTGELTLKGEFNAPTLDPIAWYGGNSGVAYEGGYDTSKWPQKQYDHHRAGTHPVGQRVPNAFGLYDMIGNVGQWCGDWYGVYPAGVLTDPTGAASGSNRVARGGSWNSIAFGCRAANSYGFAPSYRFNALGFRVMRLLPGN